MPTVTFIVGLCGAGKTWLADRIPANKKFAEGFLTDPVKNSLKRFWRGEAIGRRAGAVITPKRLTG